MQTNHITDRIFIIFLILVMSITIGSPALAQNPFATPLFTSPADQQTNQPPSEIFIARVYYSSHDELNSLSSHFDVLEVNQDQKFAYILINKEDFISLQQSGYRLEVDESKTKLLNQIPAPLPGQGPDTIPNYPCYRTVEETLTSMQNIVTNHPDMAQLNDIGDSWTRVKTGYPNGYDIIALRLTNENLGVIADKPTFFLMAEIHAREFVTTEASMRYAEYLINNYGINPDITWLLDYFKIYIVTLTNPDGRKKAEAGQLWRKNVDSDDGCTDPNSWGVDMNRNHTFSWNKGGSSPYPCAETYMGPTAGSEPEVQAIETFVISLFPDQRGPGDYDPAPEDTTGLFITLHSAAGLVLWPWGWRSNPAPNGTQLQTLGRHLAYFNGYTPQQSYQLYQTSGTSDEFAYGTLGIAGYTYEMGTDFFQDCGSFDSYIYPDNRESFLYAFKAARRPYMNPDGPDSLNVNTSPAAAVPGESVLLTATTDGTRYNGGEPTHNITGASYSIDNPSWVAGTITYTMSASDGSFNSTVEGIQATIDTTGLASGRHTIFLEGKNVNNWGVPNATFLYIIEPGVSPVIEGYVKSAGNNLPLAASVSAGLFNTTTDPATGFYSMTVISGTYDMVVESANFAPAYANDVVAQDYQTVPQDFTLYQICTLFTDDVENGNHGWTVESPWATTTESSHSPTHSWTDSPGGNYGDSRNISLTSPIFDLSDATGVTLDFWHKYQTEADWDYGYVEYNTGAGWNIAASYNGMQSSWIKEHISIPALDGQTNTRIRFHFTSDSNTVYDGWHIDDISITAGGPGCMQPEAPLAEFSSNGPVFLGQPVNFTNQTSGSEPLTYSWNFGDGVGTSTERDPSYKYNATETYTVTLEATNPLGSNTISHSVKIESPLLQIFLPLTEK